MPTITRLMVKGSLMRLVNARMPAEISIRVTMAVTMVATSELLSITGYQHSVGEIVSVINRFLCNRTLPVMSWINNKPIRTA